MKTFVGTLALFLAALAITWFAGVTMTLKECRREAIEHGAAYRDEAGEFHWRMNLE